MNKEKEFVEYLLKSILDKPEQVVVEVSESEKVNVMTIRASEDEYGKIIGKKGKVINSIRTLVAAVSTTGSKRWVLDVPGKKDSNS